MPGKKPHTRINIEGIIYVSNNIAWLKYFSMRNKIICIYRNKKKNRDYYLL